ncbi:hypothetical protein ACEPAF_1191 [Sanghuangporus sanghuang]
MAPLRASPKLCPTRRRSSLSLLTRRRSFAPKNYTFAPNVTPITYPSDPASPTSNGRSSSSPQPDGTDADIKESDEFAGIAATTTSSAGPSRPRRRGGRKDSIDHIPRPPNAFMLFRQNFVHQRHVPGSIETSHNSLSKIVGNCWKALPSKEKKVWEALAEKKKEEHKIQYPHYRFQPKHDPEKKRKRQAARAAVERAERERLMREHTQMTGASQSVPEDSLPEKLQLQQPEQEKERAMATRREQVRAMHNHLGHRRSSSVPLPSETYPGFPYNNVGGFYSQGPPNADPFNFANPALAQAPPFPNTTSSNGIAIPSLPSTMGGLTNPWYPPNNAGTSDLAGSAGLASSEQTGESLSLPSQLHAPRPRSITLSRAASPRVPMNGAGMGSIGFGFGEFSGMSSMGMGAGMGVMGMGPRASRQWHLGQLGRRASSTQPILQHQLASGAFNNFHYGPQSAFPHSAPFGQHPGQPFAQGTSTPFDFGLDQNQQQGAFDGFVGAVAEGFTNPFASSAPAGSSNESGDAVNPNSAPASANSYPAPLAPNAMWYEDSVDPMTPVQAQSRAQYAESSAVAPSLPPVDTELLNPSFNFGAASQDNSGPSGTDSHMEATSSPSGSTSAPQTAVQARFGPLSAPAHSSNSAPGTGMRDSFDFSAFNAFLQQLPAQNHGQAQDQSRMRPQERQGFEGIPPDSVHPSAQGYSIAQPVPVRKVGLPCVPETQTTASVYHEQAYADTSSYQEQNVPQHAHTYYQDQSSGAHEHAQYTTSQQSSSASSGSSADASPASEVIPMASYHHQHQVHHTQLEQQHSEVDIVSGHELLDGPVDVNAMSSANAGIQQQVQVTAEGTCAPDVNTLNYGYDYNGMTPLEAQNMYPMHSGPGEDMGAYGYVRDGHVRQTQDGTNNGSHNQNAEPRFSFSDFVHGSPFAASAPVAN